MMGPARTANCAAPSPADIDLFTDPDASRRYVGRFATVAASRRQQVHAPWSLNH